MSTTFCISMFLLTSESDTEFETFLMLSGHPFILSKHSHEIQNSFMNMKHFELGKMHIEKTGNTIYNIVYNLKSA